MDFKKLDNPFTRGLMTGLMLLSPMFTVFSGVPVLGLYFTDRKKGLIVLAIGISILAYFTSLGVAVSYFVAMFLPLLVFLEISKRKMFIVHYSEVLFKVLSIFFILFSIIAVSYFYSAGSIEVLKKTIMTVLSMSKFDIKPVLDAMHITKDTFVLLILKNSLASLMIFLLVFMVINGAFTARYVPSYGYFFSTMNYKRYKLGDAFYILGILALGLTVLFQFYKLDDTNIMYLSLDVLSTAFVKLIFAIFTFYGIMVWYSVTSQMFKNLFWQRLFFIVSVVSMGYFVGLIGFFDMWIDFRHFGRRRKEK